MPTLSVKLYDLVIVGGGINGAGVAADAAGRGLSVLLCEQGDLAGATSAASSKLIHGGLRYLEHREFRLVREALAERETLLSIAPHLVQPLRFTLPHQPHLRPSWMIRAGLFLYDHLAKRDRLSGSASVRFDGSSPLKPDIRKGFTYSDCWVDDARLVVTNALSARRNGADIRTRTRCVHARRQLDQNAWEVQLEELATGARETVRTRALVNAAGPWAESLFASTTDLTSPRKLKLIKGSHLVVNRFHDWPGAFILQNTDRRIVFVLPFEDDYAIIGTTDRAYQGNPRDVGIDDEETDYLLDVVNSHFNHTLNRRDIVGSFSGVRALCDDESTDPSAMTRDYTLEVDAEDNRLPMLSIFGGKITTYRKLAESVMARLQPWFPQMSEPWTHRKPLPGSARHLKSLPEVRDLLAEIYPRMPDKLLNRFARSYGTLTLGILGNAKTFEDLGQHFGAGLTEREVDYLVQHEWAETAEDILWRRTKLAIRVEPQQRQALEAYLGSRWHKQPLENQAKGLRIEEPEGRKRA